MMKIQRVDIEGNEKYPEFICEGMPTKDSKGFKGYIPLFEIGGARTQMRLAKIPISMYGVRSSDIFVEDPTSATWDL